MLFRKWTIKKENKAIKERFGELFGGIDQYIMAHYVVNDEEDACIGAAEESKSFEMPKLARRAVSTDEEICFATRIDRRLDEVISNLDKSFMELVFSFADRIGMTDVEIQKRANLDKRAFSKLRCGNTKNPSKSTALAIAIALKLNIDDTKDLLSRAGLALSPCDRRDLIVQYFIEHNVFEIDVINVALYEHGEPLLGSLTKE